MIDQNTYPELEPGTVSADEMTLRPRSNFVNILVLRELESHAIFTTNGEDADIATVALKSEDGPMDYAPGLMFMRKQTGSDRRFGKALQRDLDLFDEDEDECTMQVNEMCQDCVECILYGSAASSDEGSDVSITSRVMYDTAYSLRDASVVIDEKFQNAPGGDYAKSAEATIREPDFFEPGTMFPSVITLRDVTPAEVAFVLGITAKNKRYGAATSRLGRVNNRILGVYVGSEEGPANLELTRETIARHRADEETGYETTIDVVMAEALDPSRTADHVSSAFEDAIDAQGLDLQAVSEETVDDIVEIATGDDFADVLNEQRDHSRAFLDQAE
ncbi:CRISPR-associated protein Csc2/Cas7 [Halalkaliarchaeum desulfuricum]|uniref:CRISPR-associated protein Csc2/Cas7 n=1 Tax=Halalkaliarchaeum desulfuricum TaxID=2055893 RepID=A0A343TGH9_9EURY|nr:type I-D CRISPR-associated protein Cas7/Csc2 [Halalkaliarchaeum desulfuricum]AUX08201.1 CRISPR-associated protein Csc2/Cas7 [Halalkaliarchaeum desulfuricum]